MGSRREKAERALGSWHAVSDYWIASTAHAGSPVCAVVRVLAGNRGMGMALARMYMYRMADTWHVHTVCTYVCTHR
jgi:hypothetical protein